MTEERFAALVEAYLEGTLSPAGRAELEEVVRTDPDVRARFLDQVRLDVRLHGECAVVDEAKAVALILSVDSEARRLKVWRAVEARLRARRFQARSSLWRWVAAAGLLLGALAAALAGLRPPPGKPSDGGALKPIVEETEPWAGVAGAISSPPPAADERVLPPRGREEAAPTAEELRRRAEEAFRPKPPAHPPTPEPPQSPGPNPQFVSPPAEPTRAAVARIVSVEGTLWIVQGSGRRPAVAGALVAEGGGLEADARGGAVLLFPDGTRLRLGAGAVLTEIAGTPSKRVTLAHGAVTAWVAEQPAGRPMLFLTPQAEATVLGTMLRIAVHADATRLEVPEGRVRLMRFSDTRSIEIPAGHYAVAAAGVNLAARPIEHYEFEVEDFGTGRDVTPPEGARGRLYLESLAGASGGTCVSAPGLGHQVEAELTLPRGRWYLWVRARDDDRGTLSFEVRVNQKAVGSVTTLGGTKNWSWYRVPFETAGKVRIAVRSASEGVVQTNPRENLRDNPYDVVNRWDRIVLTRDADFIPR